MKLSMELAKMLQDIFAEQRRLSRHRTGPATLVTAPLSEAIRSVCKDDLDMVPVVQTLLSAEVSQTWRDWSQRIVQIPTLAFNLFQLTTNADYARVFNEESKKADGLFSHEKTLNGLMISVVNADEQGLWDASVEVDIPNAQIIFTGAAGPGGQSPAYIAAFDPESNLKWTNAPWKGMQLQQFFVEPLTHAHSELLKKTLGDAVYVESGI